MERVASLSHTPTDQETAIDCICRCCGLDESVNVRVDTDSCKITTGPWAFKIRPRRQADLLLFLRSGLCNFHYIIFEIFTFQALFHLLLTYLHLLKSALSGQNRIAVWQDMKTSTSDLFQDTPIHISF